MIKLKYFIKYHKKSLLILLAIFIAVGVIISFLYNSKEKGITGKELVYKQAEQINIMRNFLYSCDDIYSFYIIGGISQDTFAEELKVLKGQYNILRKNYNLFLEKNVVLPESQSYVSQRGSDGATKAWDHIEEMLDSTIVNDNPISKIDALYLYLNYNKVIQEDIVEYVVAFRWLYESENMEDDFSEIIGVYDTIINSSEENSNQGE